MPLYGEDQKISGYCCILSIETHNLMQRGSNHKQNCTGAADLSSSGGVWVLLLSPHAAQQVAVQAPAQDPPRVDCPRGPGSSLRSPPGARPLQPPAHRPGASADGQPPPHCLDLVRPGPGGDGQRSLRLPPAPPPLPGVPRLSPPQVQPVLRSDWSPGLSPRHRHAIQTEQTV